MTQKNTSRAKAGDFGNNSISYYQQHYAGLARGQLARQAPGLYKRLRIDKLLNNVPTSNRFINDPVAYYYKHHAGLTRGQLQKQDPNLYLKLSRSGLLGHVPTLQSKYLISLSCIDQKLLPLADSPEQKVYAQDLKSTLDRILATLTPQQEKVIRARFGLGNYEPQELEEIGLEMNLSRERIRQIENEALRRLRYPARSRELADYLSR